ncbi:MAG: winged helix-turn-helix domain-containing protein [Candidatus Nanoarchaeia archaeon]
MKKRERTEIIYDILKSIQDNSGKAKPTRILYKSNLSSQMLNDYLEFLIEKGFITKTEEKKGKFYEISSKGHKYIEDFKYIQRFMDSYDLNE